MLRLFWFPKLIQRFFATCQYLSCCNYTEQNITLSNINLTYYISCNYVILIDNIHAKLSECKSITLGKFPTPKITVKRSYSTIKSYLKSNKQNKIKIDFKISIIEKRSSVSPFNACHNSIRTIVPVFKARNDKSVNMNDKLVIDIVYLLK